MTLWTSPVPMHMAGKQVTAPRMETAVQDREPSHTVSVVLASGAGDGAGSNLGSGASNSFTHSNSSASGSTTSTAPHQRRQTLANVPSAAEVHGRQEKWLEFAPTSPQRRASFVDEPGVVDGNPFEIFKEPARADHFGSQSFYEAGASYSAKQHAPPPSAASSVVSRPASATRLSASSVPLGSERLDSSYRPSSSTGNPFYEAPLSPIRYNKPIAKVELSPQSTALSAVAFSALDPLKRTESPTASVPLDQLKISAYNREQEVLAAAKATEEQGKQFQEQEHYRRQLQLQQPQPTAHFQQNLPQPQGQAEQPHPQQGDWSAWPMQQGVVQAASQAQPASSTEWDAFGAPPTVFPQQAPPSQPTFDNNFGWQSIPGAFTTTTPNSDDFRVLGGHAAGGGEDGGEGKRGGGAIFDPVRQKSLADASFDLSVGGFFPEEPAGAHTNAGTGSRRSSGAGHAEEEEEEEGLEDHAEEEDDDSMGGDGTGELEMQEEHFGEGGSGLEGRQRSASGMYYEVAFTAPTTFGMLLERKDEWVRGSVARRERTVVTLVVEGGEAEAKGVAVGSMIVSINGEDVTGLTYKETLERIKGQARPMPVVFERESLNEDVLQGYFFVSKGPFFSNPTTMDKWKRKYIVLGGPIAKKNVLQIYDSKRAYHNTVVALFQRKRPSHRVKTYALTYAFKLSQLQERRMDGHTAPLKFFAFMTPAARFKSVRIASETRKSVQGLQERFSRFAGKSTR
ncbi:hypothetical protein NSK_000671 [Nannochloropsis salina CCMP1776]|uniref:PDZ domain-containing protein n=1 Tax=Nannochloropsis salina CCMP1776 TaxID=1027361 RepID=A0A4D9D9N9_9STRA|nr:hypothetical protein NSK_000671 [Nannochloropsis salina CCMP1776]|eukprot:TFJ88322.1 hypothetical protein NSK_000671 [Nannochloropsis salina CCMP1776]